MTGKYFHLAGIISLLGPRDKMSVGYPDYLLPLAPDFNMVERSIVECAYAGCETIWIVCDDNTVPLLRHRVGDWIEDPVYIHRKNTRQPYNYRKEIPIFYVPTHPDDMDRRDCASWGILSAAQTATKVSSQLSKWTKPRAFFVSFPEGISDPTLVRDYREAVSSDFGFCFATPSGETFQDGKKLGFTFGYELLTPLIRNFRSEATTLFKEGLKLPREKRYSGRFFSLKKAFKCINIKHYMQKKTLFYYDAGDWKGYRNYIASEESTTIKRPSEAILKFREFNRIPQEETNENR